MLGVIGGSGQVLLQVYITSAADIRTSWMLSFRGSAVSGKCARTGGGRTGGGRTGGGRTGGGRTGQTQFLDLLQKSAHSVRTGVRAENRTLEGENRPLDGVPARGI